MKTFLRSSNILLCLFLLIGCMGVHLPKVKVQQVSETQTLKWKSLVKQALEQNPDMKNARYLVTSSARSRDIAFGDYLPSANGNLERSRTRNEPSSASGPTNPTQDSSEAQNNLNLNITATQNFFNGFGTTGNFIQANKNLSATRYSYLVTSSTVRLQLRTAYVELLRLERLLDVSRRISERRRQNADLVKLRYDAGLENQGSAMRAEALAQQAEYAVRQTERLLQSQALRIARECGGEFIWPVHAEDNMEAIMPVLATLEPDFATIADRTPEVRKLIKTAESKKAAILSAQSVVWPQMDGTLNYGKSGDRASELTADRFLGVSVSVPFFNGGKNVEGILKAKADYQAARAEAVSTRDETIASLAETWMRYVNAIDFVTVKKSFLDAARKRAEIVRAEYQNGLASFTDFDAAEQENADAESAYIQSLADVFNQQAAWESLEGLTLEDALHEP